LFQLNQLDDERQREWSDLRFMRHQKWPSSYRRKPMSKRQLCHAFKFIRICL